MEISAVICFALAGTRLVTNHGVVQSSIENPPISFEISVPNSAPSLGEPIVIAYKVANHFSEPVTFDWKGENIAIGNTSPPVIPKWITVSVTDPHGLLVPLKQPRQYYGDVMRSSPKSAYGPNEGRRGALVLTRWFKPKEPGQYEVTVASNLPFSSPNGMSGVITHKHVLKVTVGPTSIRKLTATATSLEKEICESKDIDTTYTLLGELLSMPDTVSGVWRSLFFDRSFPLREFAIYELKWCDSPAAVALRRDLNAAGAGQKVYVERGGN